MTDGGHLNFQTTWGRSLRPGHDMPPHPRKQASVYTRKFGGWGTRSCIGVGKRAKWCIIAHQSNSAALRMGDMVTNGGVPLST